MKFGGTFASLQRVHFPCPQTAMVNSKGPMNFSETTRLIPSAEYSIGSLHLTMFQFTVGIFYLQIGTKAVQYTLRSLAFSCVSVKWATPAQPKPESLLFPGLSVLSGSHELGFTGFFIHKSNPQAKLSSLLGMD